MSGGRQLREVRTVSLPECMVCARHWEAERGRCLRRGVGVTLPLSQLNQGVNIYTAEAPTSPGSFSSWPEPVWAAWNGTTLTFPWNIGPSALLSSLGVYVILRDSEMLGWEWGCPDLDSCSLRRS